MKRPVESDYTSHVAYTRALEDYCDGMEQPEPVWWMLKTGHGTQFKEKLTDELRALTWKGKPMWKPLYTTPPQRKPLSDEEIQAIWEKAFESGSSPNAFARAIEAAHSRQDDYELLGYVELGGYFGIEQARKNGLSGVPVAIYVEPLLPEPNNDLTQMVPIYIKPAKEKPTT